MDLTAIEPIWSEVKESRLVDVKALSWAALSAATFSEVSAATSSVLRSWIAFVERFRIWLGVRLVIIEVMDARPCVSG